MTKARLLSTSAIVESGSNANGEYVKWDDGTMMCWLAAKALGPTTSALNAPFVRSAAGVAFTYPAPFIAPPTVSHFTTSITVSVYTTLDVAPTTTGFSLRAVGDRSETPLAAAIATGRWK